MAAQLKPCGTNAAWARHKRNGEKPCSACDAAHREYNARWMQQARANCPISECAACHCERPILRHGWCAACICRWQRAGRPDSGPPPLKDPAEVRKIRQEAALRRLERAREVDEIAVERAVFADRPAQLTTGEREAVVRRLHRLRMTDRQIAQHLDIGPTGVQAIRRRLGLPSVTSLSRKAVAA